VAQGRPASLRENSTGVRLEENGMAISDLVKGKVTASLSVRALVGERAVEPGDVLALAAASCGGTWRDWWTIAFA
jgi:hypothetical protein